MTLAFADLSSEPNRLSGAVELDGTSHPFFFSASEPITPRADALLPLGLFVAMQAGGPLRLPAGVSPRLLERAARIQDIFRAWDPSLEQTAIEAELREPSAPTGRGAACFFSGGVDSFYSVLKHRDEITDLIFCVGLDLFRDGDPSLVLEAESMAEEVAAALGKRLVRVETSIRSFSDRYVAWDLFHGSTLASIGLLFQHRFRKVLFPGGFTYAELAPRGVHPLLDPLWSTEETEFVHDGAESTRVEKVRLISASDVAMNWLRVCWENPDSAYNCGRCEKCLRTMINLRVNGALERCRTLPNELDVRTVSRIDASDDDRRAFTEQNLVAVEQLGDDPALARALESALRGGRLTDPQRWRRSLRERAPDLTATLRRWRDRLV